MSFLIYFTDVSLRELFPALIILENKIIQILKLKARNLREIPAIPDFASKIAEMGKFFSPKKIFICKLKVVFACRKT